MQGLQYDRIYRTPSSEGYLVSRGDEPLARLELHFTHSIVYGVLIFEHEPAEAEIRDLLARVDEDLVWTASVPRDDLVVTVYAGRELGVFDDAARATARGNGATNGGSDGR
ncbi:MAG TPA: hypothetical protein VFB73_13820 [Chloroflexota bacterium]|nr:hypothetical protein [Chloroflexota bacterium]